MNKRIKNNIWKSVQKDERFYYVSQLLSMSKSKEPKTRLKSLYLIRKQILGGKQFISYLQIAKKLIKDSDNDCRWQAIIVVGEFLKNSPQEVWKVICQFGVSEDDDMRTAIATILLEHLLEIYYTQYFPLLKSKILKGSPLLADTLSLCWHIGEGRSHKREIKSLVIMGQKLRNN